MKKITCPYDWRCGKTFAPEELSRDDFEFLKAATAKKMRLMFIHCPACSAMFAFDTVQWKAQASHARDPNAGIAKKARTPQQSKAILDKAGIEMPAAYFEYLTSAHFKPAFPIFKDEDAFTLYTLNELCEKVRVDGRAYLRINQLQGFAQSLKEIIEETPKSKKAQQFTLDGLAKSLTIGYENTQVLFIDHRDHRSLWIFHTDGGDAFEKTSVTLDQIIKRKK